MNGKAFINFSAFLGYPDDVHFNPWQSNRNPSKRSRKKSINKLKRDNDRAARFQERKRNEEEAASASKLGDTPEAIAMTASSPGLESVMTVSDLDFSFASPTPEVLRHDMSNDTSMVLSDIKESRPEKVQKGPNVNGCNNLETEAIKPAFDIRPRPTDLSTMCLR